MYCRCYATGPRVSRIRAARRFPRPLAAPGGDRGDVPGVARPVLCSAASIRPWACYTIRYHTVRRQLASGVGASGLRLGPTSYVVCKGKEIKVRNRSGGERKERYGYSAEFAPLRQSATAAANAARSSSSCPASFCSLAACRLCKL